MVAVLNAKEHKKEIDKILFVLPNRKIYFLQIPSFFYCQTKTRTNSITFFHPLKMLLLEKDKSNTISIFN